MARPKKKPPQEAANQSPIFRTPLVELIFLEKKLGRLRKKVAELHEELVRELPELEGRLDAQYFAARAERIRRESAGEEE